MHLKKEILIIVLLVNFSIILSSCKSTNIENENQVQEVESITKENVILKSELTNNEINLIKATGSSSYFVFDMNLSESNYQRIEVWVDVYEHGEHKENANHLGTKVGRDKNNHIMFSSQQVDDNERWVLSCFDSSGVVSNITEINKKWSSSSLTSADKVEIKEGEEQILGVILGSNSNTISGVPKDFFENNNDYIEELLKTDYVYILKCKLYT